MRVLITGCSSGIGLDAARRMQTQGWQVVATCRRPEDIAARRAEGMECHPLELADPDSVAALTDAVLANGPLDAVVNNAAFALPGAVEDMPRGALRTIFETNLFGTHDLTVRLIPHFRARGGGRIVNISSVLGLVGIPWRGPYVATKFALEGLTDEPAGRDRFELPPAAVSDRILRALTDDRPRPRYFVTRPTWFAAFGRRTLPTRALDWIARRS